MELNLCWSCSVPLYDYYTDNISNGPNISTVFLKKDRGELVGTPLSKRKPIKSKPPFGVYLKAGPSCIYNIQTVFDKPK